MKKTFLLPPLGHRIIKTAVAVFICLMIYVLRGFRGSVVQSTIAAVICIQPYITDSKAYAIERILGTIIGSAWGFIYLLVMALFPVLGQSMVVAYAVLSVIVALALYSTVLMKKSNTAALTAITLLCIVATYPNISSPLTDTINNVVDTVVGTIVAILVNIAHLPRKKHPEYLFFVRTQDLFPDRYHQIPSAIHIMLDHLYNDGAKICLISRWAPAFIISQMGLLNVNAPMIIMDGAALYDIQENRYLEVIDIPHQNAERLQEILTGFGASYNTYTIHGQTMCIYRSGPMTEAEQKEYEVMRRSPYRNYLDGTYPEEDRIAAIRVIDTAEKIDELAYRIRSVLPLGMFRLEVHDEFRFPGYKGIYFYDLKASVPAMKKRMIHYVKAEEGVTLQGVDMLPPNRFYQPGHDTPILLHRLKNMYEPVSLIPQFPKKAK